MSADTEAPPPADEKPQPKKAKKKKPLITFKRIIILLIIAGIVALALWWRGCLPGRGGGGKEPTSKAGMTAGKTGGGSPTATGAAPCKLRVDAKGISKGPKLLKLDDVINACAPAKRAELTVTGDAIHGQVKKLEALLKAAGLTVQRRQSTNPMK